ncbi:MAG: SDR family NAD(P)-dependent oxidoreductase [Bacteroidetes bacterium]|nr:SDR family NAD(P)-dependent oxidoreductase [Bacteroidota bacterium]
MILKGKTAVITGASAGLGRDFSNALIEKGATVFGLARRAEKLEEMDDRLGALFHGIECDVSDEKQVTKAFESISSQSDRLDILVNNAGLGRFGLLEDMSAEDWDVQMATNLRGVFLCTRAVLPAMKRHNAETGFGGHIVNICSVAGLVGNAEVSAYNATKFGLKGFSEALMKEVRNDGIKVSCLYPGSIRTDFFSTAGVEISVDAMTAEDITSSLIHVLETPDNYLVSEVVMRPLRPNG